MLEEQQSHNTKNELIEIYMLRNRLEELYKQSGPTSSTYIDLSIQLKVIENNFIEEQINRMFK